VGDWLEHWAQKTPDAAAFAEPAPAAAGGGGVVLGWRALRQRVGSVAQGLLDLQLPPAQPLVVLSVATT
jgi:feruloyl-CoA synthase